MIINGRSGIERGIIGLVRIDLTVPSVPLPAPARAVLCGAVGADQAVAGDGLEVAAIADENEFQPGYTTLKRSFQEELVG
jgi:hypothetical protein